jgi:hypothetical protein
MALSMDVSNVYYREEQEGPLFIAKLLKKKPPTVSRRA